MKNFLFITLLVIGCKSKPQKSESYQIPESYGKHTVIKSPSDGNKKIKIKASGNGNAINVESNAGTVSIEVKGNGNEVSTNQK